MGGRPPPGRGAGDLPVARLGGDYLRGCGSLCEAAWGRIAPPVGWATRFFGTERWAPMESGGLACLGK